MKWAIYNLLFAAVYPFLLPGFLARMLRRGGYAARMGDRFALYPDDVRAALRRPGKPFVWIHAVSVVRRTQVSVWASSVCCSSSRA